MFCSETSKRVVEDVCNVALVKSVCGKANACVRGDLLGVCLCGLSVRIHVFYIVVVVLRAFVVIRCSRLPCLGRRVCVVSCLRHLMFPDISVCILLVNGSHLPSFTSIHISVQNYHNSPSEVFLSPRNGHRSHLMFSVSFAI